MSFASTACRTTAFQICATKFKSQFWTGLYSHLSTYHRLLTAFDPQTDRQPGLQLHPTMEQYLWASCNYEEEDWDELLPLAEFPCNNAIHTSTRMTPFWANYKYDPVMQLKAQKQPSSLKSDFQTDTLAAGLGETHHTLCKTLHEAQAHHTNCAIGKVVVFKVIDKVWLSKRYFWTTWQWKKLHCTWTEPYAVITVIN